MIWKIIREAEEMVKDIDSDSKYYGFCSFCDDKYDLLSTISCEKVKKVMLEGLVEKFEISQANVEQVKFQMSAGDYKMSFSVEDLEEIVK